ncbi:hypothetical protein B0H10DRAFT_1940697 [Mycena sp. CBHHK59/15]|nr:hypothetical protein B0H10DRAFT_1940697 [Mycena sp. CBHHK59/15]
MTLHGLRTFMAHCPHLLELNPFGEPVFLKNLVMLSIGSSPISTLPAIACFISAIFPSLHTIETAWGPVWKRNNKDNEELIREKTRTCEFLKLPRIRVTCGCTRGQPDEEEVDFGVKMWHWAWQRVGNLVNAIRDERNWERLCGAHLLGVQLNKRVIELELVGIIWPACLSFNFSEIEK